MELVYYRDPKLNFGDDLNAVIWQEVLPRSVLDAEDVVLVGIGSILTAERLERLVGSPKRVVVLGTGVSYGTPPSDMSDWFFAAVRGPLSAAVLDRPGCAVTDGAILLAATELVRRSCSPDKVLFMPHRSSLRKTDWPAVCAAAGLHYVSPQTSVDEVLRLFGEARLVVTEAMHGAIVADTLRIPWVPVVINPEVDEFKWRDWTRSMRLPYRPMTIGAGSSEDRFIHWIARRNLRRAGISHHAHLENADDPADYEDYLERRFGPPSGSFSKMSESDLRLRRWIRRPMRLLERTFEKHAVNDLRRAARARPFLSDDAVFDHRLEQMLQAVRNVERHAADAPLRVVFN